MQVPRRHKHVLRDEQAGFWQEPSTTDQIATLRNIIEQGHEWNTTLYANVVDFKKDLDSVDWDIVEGTGLLWYPGEDH